MKPNLKIKQTGSKWQLTGTTVVQGMDDLEMLFRVVVMTPAEVMKLANTLTHEELRNIVVQIRAFRAKATQEGVNRVTKAAYALVNKPLPVADVTSYVVKSHSKRMGWLKN